MAIKDKAAPRQSGSGLATSQPLYHNLSSDRSVSGKRLLYRNCGFL